jgi:hypothetical protein
MEIPNINEDKLYDLGRYRKAGTVIGRGHKAGKIQKRVKRSLRSFLYEPGYRSALFGQVGMDVDASMSGRGVQPRTLFALDFAAMTVGKHSFWVRFGLRRLSKKLSRLENEVID